MCAARTRPPCSGNPEGVVPQQLRPLAADTLISGHPWTMIPWLYRSRAAALLADLMPQQSAITHGMLDSLPQDTNTAYARELLITAGVPAPPKRAPREAGTVA